MKRTSRHILYTIFDRLFERFGPREWWPGESPFEVIVGAILTQNTSWKNVEKAIHNLKQARVLSPKKLYALPVSRLAQFIRPAGFFNIKTQRLRAFLSHLFIKYHGNISALFAQDLYALRSELLSIHGIGPETADSILLYAAEKPIFVVDAYTRRLLERHRLMPAGVSYHDIQAFFMKHVDHQVSLYNEYHALIVELGKQFCRTKPRCEQCPLRDCVITMKRVLVAVIPAFNAGIQ